MLHDRENFEKMRIQLLDTKGTICCNCQKDVGANIMFHHIIPLAIGGTNNLTNIVPLCENCHGLLHNQNRNNWKELQKAGIERAKQEGKYKGRQPVKYDKALFKETVARWRDREITATKAMEIVGLKPNTFYRRVKDFDINGEYINE